MPKNPITGCRFDTLLGIWISTEDAVYQWVETGWSIVERGELQAVSQRSAQMSEEAQERPYTVKDGIARLSLSGPLTKYDTSMSSIFGGTSLARFRDSMREIRNDATIKGVFVDADSSGGTHEGTPEAAEAIRKTALVKPVHVHAEDKMMSACYYAGAGATEITCGSGALLGSVGTMLKLYDSSGNNDGSAKPVIIAKGKYKAVGAPGLPITESDKKELYRIVTSINDVFLRTVQSGRNLTDTQLEEIATARVYCGQEAVDAGLADSVCTAEEAFERLKNHVTLGTVRRGPAPALKIQTAPARSFAMLSQAQLDRLRQLPGAANIAPEQAVDFLLTAASQQAAASIPAATTQELQQLRQQNQTLQTNVSELRQQVASLQPRQADAAHLAGMHQLALDRVALMLEKGTIIPAQLEAIKGAVTLQDGKPNEAVLVSPLLPTLWNVLNINKPTGLLPDISKSQPAPKTEPGSADAQAGANGGRKIPTYQRYNEIRANNKLPPMSVEQYNAHFGIQT